MLEDMALCEEVFHAASGVGFADLIIDGHRETWPAPKGAAIASALDVLEARAQFDAPERAVNIRVAVHAGRL